MPKVGDETTHFVLLLTVQMSPSQFNSPVFKWATIVRAYQKMAEWSNTLQALEDVEN